jgi:hypothetical protein
LQGLSLLEEDPENMPNQEQDNLLPYSYFIHNP